MVENTPRVNKEVKRINNTAKAGQDYRYYIQKQKEKINKQKESIEGGFDSPESQGKTEREQIERDNK